jgi:hypothetical protein
LGTKLAISRRFFGRVALADRAAGLLSAAVRLHALLPEHLPSTGPWLALEVKTRSASSTFVSHAAPGP